MIRINLSTSPAVAKHRAMRADPVLHARYKRAHADYQNMRDRVRRGESVSNGDKSQIVETRRLAADSAVKASGLLYRRYIALAIDATNRAIASGSRRTPQAMARAARYMRDRNAETRWLVEQNSPAPRLTINLIPEDLKLARSRRMAKYRKAMEDPTFVKVQRLRARLREAVRRGNLPKYPTGDIDWKAIAAHLGPCPGDMADYQIDHIKPLASFDLNDSSQLRDAFAPDNHQWLTKSEHRIKTSAEARTRRKKANNGSW